MDDGQISAFAARSANKTHITVKKKKRKRKAGSEKNFLVLSKNVQNGTYGPLAKKMKKNKLNKLICTSPLSPQKNVGKIKKKNIVKKNIQPSIMVNSGRLTSSTPENDNLIDSMEEKQVDITETDESFNNLDKGNQIMCDSVKIAEELFSWLISPVEIDDFFKTIWEKKPLHIRRTMNNYYSELCTLKDLKKAFREEDIYFTKNIDVTSYVDGKRFTENPIGRAKSSIIWDLYSSGKSIRLLNPQTYLSKVRIMTTSLQDLFRCFVGGNIYLTPPNSQGFAPHYDDIEAFVLQLDGKKHWKLYNPRCEAEYLPRDSSRNFQEDEIGSPILEVVLEPGDLLYFPRGIIHQAKCLGERSLHITISCYQKNSWADLLEKALPVALQTAIEEDVEFREGLPLNYLDHLGIVHSDTNSKEREEIIHKFQRLLKKVIEFCPIDASADQLGKNFIHDALPPVLTKNDLIYGAQDIKHKTLLRSLKNYRKKKLGIKLVRAYACRLVSEEFSVKLYYNTENSKEYHGEEAFFLNVPLDWAPMIECLIKRYPMFTDISELMEFAGDEPVTWNSVVDLVYEIWRRGLIVFNKPLIHILNNSKG